MYTHLHGHHMNSQILIHPHTGQLSLLNKLGNIEQQVQFVSAFV